MQEIFDLQQCLDLLGKMPDPLTHGQMSKTLFARQFSQTSQASGFSDVLSTVCSYLILLYNVNVTKNSHLQSSDRKVISQKSKKKPDPVDVALETDGLCRKLMPRDGNTIFRAVSDQVNFCLNLVSVLTNGWK